MRRRDVVAHERHDAARRRDIVAEARHDASRFLSRYAVRSRDDIMPEAWLHDLDIEIEEAPLDGATAQLIRVGKMSKIVLPESQTDIGPRRFSLMHELYHVMKRHTSPSPTMMCQPKWMRRADARIREPEIGANAFSGAVLLPDFLLRKRCEISPVSLDVSHQISKEYEVSILTAAIRFIELTSERCAAIFSEKGVVKWAARSPTFTRRLDEGGRLSRESIAWQFFATGRLDERARTVPASAWIRTSKDIDVIEHSICSERHRTTLSLLWVPESVSSSLRMATR